jgi:replicative DNA helicase
MTRHDIDEYNHQKISQYIDTHRGMPLTLVDKADISMNYIRARCRTLKRTTGLDVIVVDYLQLITETDSDKRQEQVAKVSKALKVMSRELDCAVVVACQLNRNAANQDRKPTLTDLRESGSIEQDADVVMLLHHEVENGGPTGMVEVIVAKNRTGKQGSVPLPWRAYQARLG